MGRGSVLCFPSILAVFDECDQGHDEGEVLNGTGGIFDLTFRAGLEETLAEGH